MIFKSYQDLIKDIKYNLLPKLPNDIGFVYGLPRSGMIPASIISTLIGAKLGVLGEGLYFGQRGKYLNNKKKKYLIVDDSSRTGFSLKEAKKKINLDNDSFYSCVVYTTCQTSGLVDFYAKELDKKRMFEWNFTGIKSTLSSAWDLDGAICTDPTIFDDDSENYRNEILYGVKPLFKPLVKVKAIITNRIERWRPETEAWLKRNNVEFDELLMQPYETASERRRFSKPYIFKSEQLRNSDYSFFVESDLKQAHRIQESTSLPILCIETMAII